GLSPEARLSSPPYPWLGCVGGYGAHHRGRLSVARQHLRSGATGGAIHNLCRAGCGEYLSPLRQYHHILCRGGGPVQCQLDSRGDGRYLRSEEHTSELQSLTNLVCRLLLEKKKKKKRYTSESRKQIQSTKLLIE